MMARPISAAMASLSVFDFMVWPLVAQGIDMGRRSGFAKGFNHEGARDLLLPWLEAPTPLTQKAPWFPTGPLV